MANQEPAVIPDNDNDLVVVDQYDAEGLKKNLETTLAQKKHWREKAKKAEEEKAAALAELEALKKAPSNQTLPKDESPKPESKPEMTFDSLVDNFEAIRDLAPDELSQLRNTAKELGVDPVKYIKSKAGSAELKEMRQANKNKEVTPGPSGKITVFNGKPVKDVFRDPKASGTDKQAAFEALRSRRGINQHQ